MSLIFLFFNSGVPLAIPPPPHHSEFTCRVLQRLLPPRARTLSPTPNPDELIRKSRSDAIMFCQPCGDLSCLTFLFSPTNCVTLKPVFSAHSNLKVKHLLSCCTPPLSLQQLTLSYTGTDSVLITMFCCRLPVCTTSGPVVSICAESLKASVVKPYRHALMLEDCFDFNLRHHPHHFHPVYGDICGS
ncbi:hypothetical protein J6590_068712 [Homalodisca vitripennis]|nr:hypothetical protein J6590_068712 [Homalodisca vitripennis]